MNESLQIDFLAVNSGEKSGDAIVFRYGDFSRRELYKVVVIDGGTMQSGSDILEHLKVYYDTDHVDLVVCTHPDADHASGLRQVLNKCSVGELWLHKPWDHSEHICHLFHDGRITDDSLSTRLQDEYNYAYELMQIAEAKDIDVREPFAGRDFGDGVIQVLGPDIDYYRELIPNFTKSPEQKDNALIKAFTSLTESVTNWLDETFDIETLDDRGVTTSENLSSAVLLLTLNGEKFLFTGDAGMESMHKVIDYCAANNIDISNIRFMQAPHHGSKRNISPAILDAIKCRTAYISASKESEKHPSKKVINAFIRRGAKVFSTEGQSLCHKMNVTGRANYGAATPHSFYDKVEA
jgi:beta-lactamase superfamily II metal-dependent hydrolase